MPSYIELDKQSSFPASSDVGKLILGFNNDGSLQATDNNGQSVGVVGAPYKVYTALLTQSGGDDPQYYTETNTLLTIGVTYTISAYDQGDDFTNIGASSNRQGVSFVATGTTPAVWSGSTLDYNTGAPVVTVLENTIGDIWFTYHDIGRYVINSSGLFTSQKTFSTFTNSNNGDVEGGIALISMLNTNTSEISLHTGVGYSFADDLMTYGMPIEIRNYS
jgi:hypothetical protein